MDGPSEPSFVWPDRPYPDASARVDEMMAAFHLRCLVVYARQVAGANPRFGHRLSVYERAFIGRCEENATTLAEHYGISKKHVHYLRRKARLEDSQK